MQRSIVEVDVGQSLDPTAVCVMSRIPVGPHPTGKFFEPADPEHDETKPPEGPAPDDLETAFRERHRKNRTRPTANELAAHQIELQGAAERWKGETREYRNRHHLAHLPTPLHPDTRGGPVIYLNGPNCKPTYAIGSLEWQTVAG